MKKARKAGQELLIDYLLNDINILRWKNVTFRDKFLIGKNMKRFTVRVELHGDDPDYQLLHDEMEKANFFRTIKGDTGNIYQLPDAEYNYSANVSRGIVLDRAYAIANRVQKSPSVLVSESVGRAWKGLKKV